MKEVLRVCANTGVKLGVVTSSFRSVVEKTLQTLDIKDYFDVLVAGDDITKLKPHPESIFLALKHLGSKPEETVIIGDSRVDILAGKAADITSGLFYPEIHHKFYDLKNLLLTSPDFVFHNYNELDKHLFLMD